MPCHNVYVAVHTNRYAVAALAEYRPLVLQLGEEDVCAAAVASITRSVLAADSWVVIDFAAMFMARCAWLEGTYTCFILPLLWTFLSSVEHGS